MEIYEEFCVLDDEILVGFYVPKNLKARFDAACRSEGIRNGRVLVELMSDHLQCYDSMVRERKEQEAITMKKNQAEFLELFGGTPGPHGSDGQSRNSAE